MQRKNKKSGSQKTGNGRQGVALSKSKSNTAPKINDRTSTVISKTEFIANLAPSDAFTVNEITLNPANPLMFPWLSSVAHSWEKFKLRKLIFEYKTAQSTLVPGMVMMAPEYNATAAPPESKLSLLEYAYAKRGPIWENFSMPVPVSTLTFKDYYVWDGTEVSEPLLYNPLKIVWATDSVATDISYIGELWVHYEVEFFLPQTLSSETMVHRYYQCISGFFDNNVTQDTEPFYYATNRLSIGGCGISVASNSDLYFSQPFKGTMTVGVFITNNIENQGAATIPIAASTGDHTPTTFGDGRGVNGWYWGSSTNHCIVYGMNLNQEAGSTLRFEQFGCNFPLADPPLVSGGNYALTFRVGPPQISFYQNFTTALAKPRLDPFLKKGQKVKQAPTDKPVLAPDQISIEESETEEWKLQFLEKSILNLKKALGLL